MSPTIAAVKITTANTPLTTSTGVGGTTVRTVQVGNPNPVIVGGLLTGGSGAQGPSGPTGPQGPTGATASLDAFFLGG